MSLSQRATKLEALAQSHAIRRERDAFKEWLHGLTREEGIAFTEFCLPTLVEMGVAPTYSVLPSKMPVKERREYAEEWQRMIAGFKKHLASDEVASHRTIMDLWRRFVQRTSAADKSR